MRRHLPAFLLAASCAAFVSAAPAVAANDQASLDAAIVLFHAKRVPEARAQLAEIVAREPDNARALWFLGQAELMMQRRDDAVNTLARAAKLAPRDHRIVAEYGGACLLRATELGASLRAIGLARRGRNALEQAVALAPDVVGYREGLVQFYTRAPRLAGGDFDRAYAHIDEIARHDPARATVLRANTLAAEKRHDEALAVCETFLKEHPDHYLALFTLGRIASETGRELARGEAALRRCLELAPRSVEPDHAMVHYRLGLIAEKAKRPADARLAYQTALDLQPAHIEAAEALVRLNQ